MGYSSALSSLFQMLAGDNCSLTSHTAHVRSPAFLSPDTQASLLGRLAEQLCSPDPVPHAARRRNGLLLCLSPVVPIPTLFSDEELAHLSIRLPQIAQDCQGPGW